MLGTNFHGATKENHDRLRELMREATMLPQAEAVRQVFLQIVDDPDLLEQAACYALSNIYVNCVRELTRRRATPGPDMRVEEVKIREIVAASIRLWNWKIPSIGKRLPDCTFSEIADAAPLAGRFLARLSTQGAPGTLVREVFKTERDLQDFWRIAQ